MTVLRSRISRLVAPALLLALVACAAPAEPPARFGPSAPQPAAEVLAPGLAVAYWYQLFRNVDELAEVAKHRPGRPGAALASLDHRMGHGKVLTSEAEDGVGAEISGLIRLGWAGTYRFAANSNDGVRIEIGGARVVEDGDVHGDRLSPEGSVTVTESGWYDLRVLYFERRNTATLQLFWTPPGKTAPEIVSAAAFAQRR